MVTIGLAPTFDPTTPMATVLASSTDRSIGVLVLASVSPRLALGEAAMGEITENSVATVVGAMDSANCTVTDF